MRLRTHHKNIHYIHNLYKKNPKIYLYMTISDTVKELFANYSTLSNLPTEYPYYDELVRYTVGSIMSPSRSEKAVRFLYDLKPQHTANYLVAALDKPNQEKIVIAVLQHYGPSDYTVIPLVATLRDNRKRGNINHILLAYGPHDVVVRRLVGALQNPELTEPAQYLLKEYGPTNTTCFYLTITLKNESQVPTITEILREYGPCKVNLRYIRHKLNSSSHYRPCQELLTFFEQKKQIHPRKKTAELSLSL